MSANDVGSMEQHAAAAIPQGCLQVDVHLHVCPGALLQCPRKVLVVKEGVSLSSACEKLKQGIAGLGLTLNLIFSWDIISCLPKHQAAELVAVLAVVGWCQCFFTRGNLVPCCEAAAPLSQPHVQLARSQEQSTGTASDCGGGGEAGWPCAQVALSPEEQGVQSSELRKEIQPLNNKKAAFPYPALVRPRNKHPFLL